MAKKVQQVSEFEKARIGFLFDPIKKGRFFYLLQIINQVWSDSSIEWNPWLEDQLQSLCDDSYVQKVGNTTIRIVSWTGPGGAGKTFASGLFAMAWFLVDPDRSSVTLTSTSKTAMGGRIWAVIKDLFISAVNPDTGDKFEWHIVDSRKELQWPRGNQKNSVSCFAVEEGELLKSVDKIKGRHTERMLLIVDEANSTPDAIFRTIPNMKKGCKELVVIVIGNAVSFWDNHGRSCEPSEGWNSITIEHSRWRTKGVGEWQLPPGICCHYDGRKSPNVLAGKTIYPHIYSMENWHEATKWGENTIDYWSQDRGFWPPEGTVNTVFSEPLINRCDGAGFLTFYNQKAVYGFLDPGFGGDRCVLRIADVGDIDNGKFGVQLRQPIYISPKIDNEAERDYQIARITIDECRSRGVSPDNFGSDATAIGRGVHAILAAEWSPSIHRIEWGGKASEKPSSQADGRPSDEVYADRVTELWFAAREFMESGQLKGFCVEDIKQSCSREYDRIGRRYALNTKLECKKKLGYSPDEMDGVAGLIEVIRRNGIMAEGKIAELEDTGWNRVQREAEKELAIADGPIGIEERGGWADNEFRIDWRE